MKRICLLLLLLALLSPLLCACKQDVQVEDSDPGGPQTYQLPTEWKVTKDGETLRYFISYEGGSVTVTKEGKVIQNVTLLRFTVDENGNAVAREENNGTRLEAVYDAEGRLTETLLRDRDGALQQRTEYDEAGREARVYVRGKYDEVFLSEYRYGENGERTCELQYHTCRRLTYEYHPNGQAAAENVYLMDALLRYRTEYDKDGNTTWKYDYDEAGNVVMRYAYNEEGNIAEAYDAEGNRYVCHWADRSYDDDGRLTEYKQYFGDTLSGREEYGYDENGACSVRRCYDGDGRMWQESFMTYDGAGTLTVTETRVYNPENGELSERVETQWDEAGNPVQETAYDPDGTVASRRVTEYGSVGGKWVVTLLLFYDGEGNLRQRQEKTYDGNGNLTSDTAYDGDGVPVGRGERSYDERGNLTHLLHRDQDGVVTEHEQWVYDGQDNLLEQIRYNEDGSVRARWAYEYAYTFDGAGRPASVASAMVAGRRDHTYETGSGLRRETVRDEEGNVLRTCETVYDGNGNPRIRQSVWQEDEVRIEYEWTPEGGLRGCVRYGADKEPLSRLEASAYVACELTEAQYRQILELLLAATGAE